MTWKIRPYRPADEAQWLRCRVLAFLDTAYFDNVYREKEHYANPSIELVAELGGQIIGLIDIECEAEPGSVCSPPATPKMDGKAGMIWNLAVHPDYRHQGVGKALLEAAIALAQPLHLRRLEAWTRDDAATLRWYEAQGFEKVESYWHVYLEGGEVDAAISSAIPGLSPRHLFAHYQGDNAAQIQKRFRRVHECSRYDLILI
ncbi:GNAT family N-acetyltransferase [Nodosilinea sp. LEGE 07088]|uniref:GNAT family N-acetyltransferase n=1 Tax=Nodosilinea sp. LEGE 07088 TaxID=2777968 RepID=UPI0024140BB3